MQLINETRREGLSPGGKRAMGSTTVVRKYTYVLPSGRRLKVIVDDDSEIVETGSANPCFLLRMEDHELDD